MKIVLDTNNMEYGLMEKQVGLPETIRFFDKNNNEYDSAFYKSENATKRYQIVDECESKAQFFEKTKLLKNKEQHN